MNTIAHIEPRKRPARGPCRSFLLYEDLIAGEYGLEFVATIERELGEALDYPEAHWWFDMAEVPAISTRIANQAASSSHVILALRGDTMLSSSKKEWILQWLCASEDSVEDRALIVVVDPNRMMEEPCAQIEAWIERHVVGRGVNAFFFAGSTAGSPADRRTEENGYQKWDDRVATGRLEGERKLIGAA